VTNAPAAGHALDILTLLASHGEPMPAAAIARDLGLPRSSVYHLLTVLADRGFVSHLPEARRYGLGRTAYEIGSAFSRQGPLQRRARPILTRLVDRTGVNGHFAVLHGTDVLYLIEERATGRPPLVTDVGVRLPATLTASGMALLAALPPRQVRALFPTKDALVQRDSRGPATLQALKAALVDTRARGYAVERHTVSPGLASVARAVLDHTGHPVGAFALTFPVEEVDATAEARLAGEVGDAAQVLTARIGGRVERV
jgi:DNA-binding IclR family transcriptional regulator